MTQRALIVNADDFGRSPSISRGIVEAHARGVVTSTTLMVNLPWTAEAATMLGAAPTLAAGLHFNLCYGTPVANDVPSLLAPGTTHCQRDEVLLQQAIRSEDVERELLAQLARFEELTGRPPDHIDSHRHLHLWPAVHEVLVPIARERGLPVRGGDATHIAALRAAGVRCPDHFVVNFYGADNISVEALSGIIRSLPPGTTELMCHPGYDDEALADSSYRSERQEELRTLCNAAVRALLTAEDIDLVAFGAAQPV